MVARSDTVNTPGATTSGLNRPPALSQSTPTFPPLENPATWLLSKVVLSKIASPVIPRLVKSTVLVI